MMHVLWFVCAFWAVWDIQSRVLRDKPNRDEI